jgi:hypothetical protein
MTDQDHKNASYRLPFEIRKKEQKKPDVKPEPKPEKK